MLEDWNRHRSRIMCITPFQAIVHSAKDLFERIAISLRELLHESGQFSPHLGNSPRLERVHTGKALHIMKAISLKSSGKKVER